MLTKMTSCSKHFVNDEIDETKAVRFHAETGQIRFSRDPAPKIDFVTLVNNVPYPHEVCCVKFCHTTKWRWYCMKGVGCARRCCADLP